MMTKLAAKTPRFGRLTGLISTLLLVATEWSDPAKLPTLTAFFGPVWAKVLISVLALVVVLSEAFGHPKDAKR